MTIALKNVFLFVSKIMQYLKYSKSKCFAPEFKYLSFLCVNFVAVMYCGAPVTCLVPYLLNKCELQ